MIDKATLLLEIQRRIGEIQAKRPLYADLEIADGTRFPAASPQVGIWWLHGENVIRHSVAAESCSDPSDPQCVEVEHIYTWPLVQQRFAREFPELLQVGYAGIPRGRVWYHRGFRQFSITCAPGVAGNADALALIERAFGIRNRGCSVVIDPQYPR